MPNSQNGYPANNVNLTSSRLVPGTTRKIRVRNGPAGDLLLWVASQFDRLVEDIDPGVLDDWGYAERDIRGGGDISNHASGTAIDLNATSHPLATAPAANYSAAEIAAIRAIVGRTGGCVRWGGDYTGRKDGMHFEIVASEARCAAVLATLTAAPGGGSTPTTGGGSTVGRTVQEDDMVTAPAGTREHIELIVKGKKELYIACAFSQKVTVHAILFYGSTKRGGVGGGYAGEFATPKQVWVWDENRPGPVEIPDEAAMATVLYTAAHSFAVGAA